MTTIKNMFFCFGDQLYFFHRGLWEERDKKEELDMQAGGETEPIGRVNLYATNRVNVTTEPATDCPSSSGGKTINSLSRSSERQPVLAQELAEKEIFFLKKAAAFFAKEIDQSLIGLQNNTAENSAFAGC